MWHADKLEDTLKLLVTESHLGIPEENRQVAVRGVLTLLQQRQSAADSAYAHHAATAPLDPERCSKLRIETATSIQKHRQWIEAIRKLGGTSRSATPVSAISPLLERYLPRDCLIPDSTWGSGFGESIGENAALWESVRLIGSVEQIAERGRPVTSLAQLADAVRDARRELVNRGYEPNLLILPEQDRFAGALFQKPLWQVEESQKFGSINYGKWEGLHVFRFPYSDPKSIIVADARWLFGKHGDGHIDVAIRELTNEEVAKLAQDREAEGGDRAKRRDEAQVLVTVRAWPILGLVTKEGDNTPKAALALDITESDGGYAMLLTDNSYHRPSCTEIEFEQEIQYSLVPHLTGESKDREPCQVCHPELWNMQGRRGVVGGQQENTEGKDTPKV